MAEETQINTGLTHCMIDENGVFRNNYSRNFSELTTWGEIETEDENGSIIKTPKYIGADAFVQIFLETMKIALTDLNNEEEVNEHWIIDEDFEVIPSSSSSVGEVKGKTIWINKNKKLGYFFGIEWKSEDENGVVFMARTQNILINGNFIVMPIQADMLWNKNAYSFLYSFSKNRTAIIIGFYNETTDQIFPGFLSCSLNLKNYIYAACADKLYIGSGAADRGLLLYEEGKPIAFQLAKRTDTFTISPTETDTPSMGKIDLPYTSVLFNYNLFKLPCLTDYGTFPEVYAFYSVPDRGIFPGQQLMSDNSYFLTMGLSDYKFGNFSAPCLAIEIEKKEEY